MITAADFRALVASMGQVAQDDIAWAEYLTLPASPEVFALEAIFVICNSGMKNTVAQGIYERCRAALYAGTPVFDVFKHPGKSAAIEAIWHDRSALYQKMMDIVLYGDEHKRGERLLEFCAALPWIGDITKYHLAKNFGADVAKPDVHLQRLADRDGCTVDALCQRLAGEVGLRVATVDTVLWRACANGHLNSRTGELHL